MRRMNAIFRVVGIFAVVAMFASLLVVQPVLAAGITVNSLADTTVSGDGQCTLREALNNVNAAADTTGGDCAAGTGTGDTISFDLTGTITLTASNGTLMLTKNVTIQGPGANNLVLDGGCTMYCGQPFVSNGVLVLQVGSGATASISGVTIARGGGFGGGGVTNLGSLTIADSIITSNGTNLFGGGIENLGTMTVMRSAITANSAGNYGGGIDNEKSLTVVNSTISGNSSSSGGAAIFDQPAYEGPPPSLLLVNSTVSGNSNGISTHGAVYVQSGTATVENSLIAGNTIVRGPGSTSGADLAGAFAASSAYDLVGDGTGETGIVNGSNGNQVGTSASPINPQLAPLGDNGGPTPTMALLPGSPAIDRIPASGGCGVGIVTDQRGLPRPSGAGGLCDVGAFEVQSSLPQPKPPGPILSAPAPLPIQPKPQGPSLGVPAPLPPPRP
jgi:CSLREA domain-containing protein